MVSNYETKTDEQDFDNKILFDTSGGDTIKCNRRIGIGSYGAVYESVQRKSGDKMAVKRNTCEIGTVGFATLKEADMLMRLNGHPLIVGLKGFIRGSPAAAKEVTFPKGESIETMFESASDVRDDDYHFGLDLASGTLANASCMKRVANDTTTFKKVIPAHAIKKVSAQLIVAMEWIHSRGIVHRDLKPANVLINNSASEPEIKLCDFGLGGSVCGTKLSSPGIYTHWYRCPEICLGVDYTSKADMWALGLILFELVSRKGALMKNVDDNVSDIFVALFNKIPTLASADTIENVAGGKVGKLSSGKGKGKTLTEYVFSRLSRDARSSVSSCGLISESARAASISLHIRSALGLSVADAKEFNEALGGEGSLDDYCDLISRLISFDPDSRLGATEAIGHPFFTRSQTLTNMISGYRTEFNPTHGDVLPVITIRDCPERSEAMKLAVHIYNNRGGISWYEHRVLMHAIDLFDRHVTYSLEDSEVDQIQFDFKEKADISDSDSATIVTDRIIHKNPRDVYLYFYMCLYMSYKIFLTLDTPMSWADFAPKGYSKREDIKKIEKFETHMLERVCEFRIYRDTLYEVVVERDGRVRESSIRECLVNLTSIDDGKEWSGGSVRALQRYF